MLSPLWIVSIVFLVILSIFIIISSEGMVKEDEQQRYYRKLRTGYAVSSLLVAVLVEILSILWLEGILNTFVIIVLIPYYCWTLFYISKLVILYSTCPLWEIALWMASQTLSFCSSSSTLYYFWYQSHWCLFATTSFNTFQDIFRRSLPFCLFLLKLLEK